MTSLDGPHVYGTFHVPPGRYLLSLYFFNKDGHSSANRIRDYIVSVQTMKIPEQLFEKLGTPNCDAEREFFRNPYKAKLRIRDFWGGVYKRFYVDIAPGEYVTIRLDASYSLNTIVSGIFFDPVGDMKSLAPLGLPWPPPRKPTNWAEEMENPTETVWWGANAIDCLLCLRDSNPVWYYSNARINLLLIARYFITPQNGKPYDNIKISSLKDKERIRVDLAKMLSTIQMFNWADSVDYGETKYNSYWWNRRTQLGRNKFQEFDWDEHEVRQYMDSNIKKQTW
ncbi:MAG: hypothetical protein LBJ67_00130 [Planctomycetaceae bacterium]|nr:hypothetical protein [Planctomycetaceae bacterium]